MNDRAERGRPLSLPFGLFGLFGEETPIERVRRRSA
jgi:hypothetical protein